MKVLMVVVSDFHPPVIIIHRMIPAKYFNLFCSNKS